MFVHWWLILLYPKDVGQIGPHCRSHWSCTYYPYSLLSTYNKVVFSISTVPTTERKADLSVHFKNLIFNNPFCEPKFSALHKQFGNMWRHKYLRAT